MFLGQGSYRVLGADPHHISSEQGLGPSPWSKLLPPLEAMFLEQGLGPSPWSKLLIIVSSDDDLSPLGACSHHHSAQEVLTFSFEQIFTKHFGAYPPHCFGSSLLGARPRTRSSKQALTASRGDVLSIIRARPRTKSLKQAPNYHLFRWCSLSHQSKASDQVLEASSYRHFRRCFYSPPSMFLSSDHASNKVLTISMQRILDHAPKYYYLIAKSLLELAEIQV